jgi:hypothetical protein
MDDLSYLQSLFDGLPDWQGISPQYFDANFLGVQTDVRFFQNEAGAFAKASQNETFKDILSGPRTLRKAPPKVADGEAFFEWAAVLRSVNEADGHYVMIELGGGFGARAVDAAAALAAVKPMPATLVVVEPIAAHVARARRHFATNGLDPDRHWFLNAAVGVDNAPVLIPQGCGRYGNTVNAAWIHELVDLVLQSRESTTHLVRSLIDTGGVKIQTPQGVTSFGFVSTVTLRDVLFPFDRVDLIDVDIQSAELPVLSQGIDILSDKVKLLNIGTHSEEIHAGLTALFAEKGWRTLANYAPNSSFETACGNFRTGDGILMVENPVLRA